MHVTADSSGKFKVAFDSIDQGTAGTPGTGALEGNHFTCEIPSWHVHYSGALSSDRNRITGEWKQQSLVLPLILERVAGNEIPTVLPPSQLRHLRCRRSRWTI
jgi:hypothetical protein